MAMRVLLLLLVGFAAANGQATTQPAQSLRQLVTALAADEPVVRDAAHKQLLQLNRAELPALKEVVASGAAKLPSQQEALKDVVRHVFLSGEPYPLDVESRLSFIGLGLGASFRPLHFVDGTGRLGVGFDHRLPGFPGYAVLEEGDVIVGVEELPDLQFEGQNPLGAIRTRFAAGEVIHLIVLRDDRTLRLPLRLAQTPVWGGGDANQMMSERILLADEYWEREFAPLFRSLPS